MNIWEIDKLILFIAFVIPGFVSLKTYELIFPSDKSDSSKQLVDAITYSCINYALLFGFIIAVERSNIESSARVIYYLFYFIVLFIAPILWVLLWKSIRTSSKFQKNAPHPTQKPWDYVFSKRKKYWIKITMKDGTKLAGKYSGESFASSSPAHEQIYLEESWLLSDKGGFDRKKNNSEGIIVLSSEIQYLELFKL